MKNKNRFKKPARRIPDGCNKNRIKNRFRKYFFLLQAVFQATEINLQRNNLRKI